MKRFNVYTWLLVFCCLWTTTMTAHAQDASELADIQSKIRNGRADTATVSRLASMANRHIDKPGDEPTDMDSAAALTGYIEALCLKLRYQHGLALGKLISARVQQSRGNVVKTRQLTNEALAIFRAGGKENEIADALRELAGTYGSDSLNERVRLYAEAADHLHKAGDVLKQAQTWEYIGDLYQVNFEYRKALGALEKCLGLYKSIGYERVQGVYDLMGTVYLHEDDIVNALKFGLLAVQTGERLHDTSPLMATIYNRVSDTYQISGSPEKAMEFLGKGIYVSRLNRDTTAVQNLQFNAADVLRSAGHTQEALDSLIAATTIAPFTDIYDITRVHMRFLRIYTDLKQFKNAEPHYKAALSAYNSGQLNANEKQVMRLKFVQYLQHTGRYSATYQFLNIPPGYHGTMPETVRRQTFEYLFFKSDSAMGRYLSAIRHYQAYKVLSDSLQGIEKTRQLNQLQVQFDTDKKDKDIELLTQRGLVQMKDLEKERVARNLVIAGILLVLLLSCLIYNRYRIKRRNNIRLEVQQQKINRQNAQLRKLLTEKEWLLKEIHHRVKNNLQIVISLLNSQSSYLDNQDAVAAIQDSQQRMQAMSLIHQRLYQSNNLASIDMKWYIQELIGYIRDSFHADDRIRFQAEIEIIELDVAQAVPLGLIINEAVSNAVKYAFPAANRGTVFIGFRMKGERECELRVSDNGTGFPTGFDAGNLDSLGMSLMSGLTDQLGGIFETDGSNGVTVIVRFEKVDVLQATGLEVESTS